MNTPKEVAATTDCTVETDIDKLFGREPIEFRWNEDCQVLYVLIPDFLTVSGLANFLLRLKVDGPKGRLVFVAGDVSDLVVDSIRADFAGCRIMRLAPS